MKRIGMVLGVFLLSVMSVIPTYASAKTAENSVTNTLKTGNVDIELKEFHLDDNGREVEWTDMKDVCPGQYISKIPRVTNKGAGCYIRAKINIDNDVRSPMTIDDLEGISNDWVRKGEYIYHVKPLNQGDSVDLFTGFEIPREWDREAADKAINIEISVDAVQSKNFIVDLESDNPWGDIRIEKSKYDGQYELNTFSVSSDANIQVVCVGDAITITPDNFFSEFGTMMPGDVMEDTVDISNNYSKAIELFFKTSPLENEDMLSKIMFTVSMAKDNVVKDIYKGNLNDGIPEYLSLGVFEQEEKGMLHFRLELSGQTDNALSLEKAKSIWYFRTRYEEPEKSSIQNIIASIPKTGDSVQPTLLLLTLLAAAALAAAIYAGKAGWKRDKENSANDR